MRAFPGHRLEDVLALTDEEFEAMLRAANRLHQLEKADAKMRPEGQGRAMSSAEFIRSMGISPS